MNCVCKRGGAHENLSGSHASFGAWHVVIYITNSLWMLSLRGWNCPFIYGLKAQITVSSNEANIHFKFRSNNFMGLMPLWPLFLWLLFSLGLLTQLFTMSASKPLLFPSLCDMECFYTHLDPITVCTDDPRPVLPSLTASSYHIPLFIAISRISWECVEWGEGS